MRWVFIRPLNRSPYYDPELQEPLGLQCLSAACRAVGDPVLILDAALDHLADVRLARRAVSFAPDAIGFSIMTGQELESVQAIHAECVRASAGRSIRFVAGGNLVSTELERAAQLLDPSITLVPFEGENALRELRGAWSGGQPGPAEPRVVTGTAVVDLATLPFPDRPYARQILGSGWAFNLQGSRGCCGSCRHCASTGMRERGGRHWRGRPPEAMVEEMGALHRQFGASSFNFVDEDWLGPNGEAPLRARAFAEALRRRGTRMSFGIQVRPDSLTDDIIDTLTEVGLTYVFVGIESDDPADFRRWGRPWVPDPYRFVTRLRERGAEANAGVMLFHSHSTLAGIRRFARTLQAHHLLDYRSAVNRQDAMPGSRLYDEAMGEGLLDPERSGPQHLPFVDSRVDALFEDLQQVLAPLGPPSMEALCALPPLLASRHLDRDGDRCETLLQITAPLDAAVASTLFSLIDVHERGGDTRGETLGNVRQANLAAAVSASRELVAHRYSPSFERLREAIRIDAGV